MGQRDVYLFLKKNKSNSYTVREISKKLGICSNATNRAVTILYNKGFIKIESYILIHRKKAGKYTIK